MNSSRQSQATYVAATGSKRRSNSRILILDNAVIWDQKGGTWAPKSPVTYDTQNGTLRDGYGIETIWLMATGQPVTFHEKQNGTGRWKGLSGRTIQPAAIAYLIDARLI